MKRRFFIDMDGTLANFHKNPKFLELMFSEGYFQHLEAFPNLASAVGRLCREEGVEVYVLSSIPESEYSRIMHEKMQWLKQQRIELPLKRCLFPLVGMNKAKYVQQMLDITLSKRDILLDDYNKNLEEWCAGGGSAVKFVNDFNDRGKNGSLWKGKRIYYHWRSRVILDKLIDLCEDSPKKNVGSSSWHTVSVLQHGDNI